jgi:hypothetical protein
VSRYETGNILPPLTVVDMIARLLHTTIADLLTESPAQPEALEHIDRIGIWLTNLPLSDRDWIERVVKQLVEHCMPRKRGRPRTRRANPSSRTLVTPSVQSQSLEPPPDSQEENL